MSRKRHLAFELNGEEVDILCQSQQSLLEVIRDELRLTGTKEGCNDGNCGSCSVTLDGVLVNACCVLALEVQDRKVETIEGMAHQGDLHPLQACFLRETAFQCGICTPGFLMSCRALLEENPDPSEAEIRHWLAGNLCRCTGYDGIVAAVQAAAREMKEG